MTISMIPTGQPYGQRQDNEAAQAEAGLPNRIRQAPPLSRAVPQTQDVGSFDGLTSRQPTQFGNLRETQDSRIIQILETSPSPILRDLARRIRGL